MVYAHVASQTHAASPHASTVHDFTPSEPDGGSANTLVDIALMLTPIDWGWPQTALYSVATDLPPGDVHAWLVDLDNPPRIAQELAALLDDHERARAARFVSPKDRRHHEVTHGLLRTILGHYTGNDPKSLQFALGREGKPSLVTPLPGEPLVFNLSHSGHHALIGVARGLTIGIDLEAMHAVPEIEAIAKSHFAAEERAELMALPLDVRLDGFLRCWTCKEAYVKALGGGLSIPLDGFCVAVDPKTAVQLKSIRGSTLEAARWTLRAGKLSTDAWAAVIVDRPSMRLQTFSMA